MSFLLFGKCIQFHDIGELQRGSITCQNCVHVQIGDSKASLSHASPFQGPFFFYRPRKGLAGDELGEGEEAPWNPISLQKFMNRCQFDYAQRVKMSAVTNLRAASIVAAAQGKKYQGMKSMEIARFLEGGPKRARE
jgi:hypothetical protein